MLCVSRPVFAYVPHHRLGSSIPITYEAGLSPQHGGHEISKRASYGETHADGSSWTITLSGSDVLFVAATAATTIALVDATLFNGVYVLHILVFHRRLIFGNSVYSLESLKPGA